LSVKLVTWELPKYALDLVVVQKVSDHVTEDQMGGWR